MYGGNSQHSKPKNKLIPQKYICIYVSAGHACKISYKDSDLYNYLDCYT